MAARVDPEPLTWLLQLQKRLNLTRTVRKLPINEQLERVGHYIHDDRQLQIKYDELPEVPAEFLLTHALQSQRFANSCSSPCQRVLISWLMCVEFYG